MLQDNTDSNVQELKNQIQTERQKERQATMAVAAMGDPRSRLRRPRSEKLPRPMARPRCCPLCSGPALLSIAAERHADATNARTTAGAANRRERA